MRNIFFLLFMTFTLISKTEASVIKKTIIDGQLYSCRPSHMEPVCNVDSDLGFYVSRAADLVDAAQCLDEAQNNRTKVQNCFLQERIKKYSKDLDIQMISRACWGVFLSICTENKACPQPGNPQKTCGYLGAFLDLIRTSGLNNLFNEKDGVTLCQSLIGQ